ncbi:hypothetical protein ACSFA0_22875 [Variovorax sp. LT1P1]|uniref:hypothetical protein n=1 Tax=Variovorax sp. LT1P1 TaxID=3443730 RepID=UPI003F44BBF7
MISNQPNIALRFYPIPAAGRWSLVKESLALAPYAIAFFTAAWLLASSLSGLPFWIGTAVLLALHVYMTTDLLLPRARKAEIMGFGLERRHGRLWFVGYSENARLYRNVAAPIEQIDVGVQAVRVLTKGGIPVCLYRLSGRAQDLFVRGYEALRSGATLDEVLVLDADIERRGASRLRFNDGAPRQNKRQQEVLGYALLIPEFWLASQLAVVIKSIA